MFAYTIGILKNVNYTHVHLHNIIIIQYVGANNDEIK